MTGTNMRAEHDTNMYTYDFNLLAVVVFGSGQELGMQPSSCALKKIFETLKRTMMFS